MFRRLKSNAAAVPLGPALEVARIRTALELVQRIASRRSSELQTWFRQDVSDTLRDDVPGSRLAASSGRRGTSSSRSDGTSSEDALLSVPLRMAAEMVRQARKWQKPSSALVGTEDETAEMRTVGPAAPASASGASHESLAPWKEPNPSVAVHSLCMNLVDASSGAKVAEVRCEDESGCGDAHGAALSSRIADDSSAQALSLPSACPSSACLETVSDGRGETSLPLPLISSECPGWVCYAEKTSPQSLAYISKTRSPQQLLGLAIRRVLQRSQRLSPATSLAHPDSSSPGVYHVSV